MVKLKAWPPRSEPDGRTNLVDAPRVQRFLGVSRSTLMRYIAARKIEAIKMDGEWRFRWEDVERFVQRRTQKAAVTTANANVGD